jgi:DNA adenine methylase
VRKWARYNSAVCFSNGYYLLYRPTPYTAGGKKAGKRRYRYCELDHEKLFELCEDIRGDFLLTDDNAEEVRVLARRHSFQMRLIPMTNTHHATMEELIIGKDLGWMDDLPVVREPEEEYRTAAQKL